MYMLTHTADDGSSAEICAGFTLEGCVLWAWFMGNFSEEDIEMGRLSAHRFDVIGDNPHYLDPAGLARDCMIVDGSAIQDCTDPEPVSFGDILQRIESLDRAFRVRFSDNSPERLRSAGIALTLAILARPGVSTLTRS